MVGRGLAAPSPRTPSPLWPFGAIGPLFLRKGKGAPTFTRKVTPMCMESCVSGAGDGVPPLFSTGDEPPAPPLFWTNCSNLYFLLVSLSVLATAW